MNAAELIGSWNLISFEIEKDGISRPWRDKSHGLLIYTAEGTVSVSINAVLNHQNAIMDSKELFDSILFYAGTYETSDGNVVVHHVTNATDPNRIGKDMIRTTRLDGKFLHIEGRGSFGIAKIVWERI